jgi:hypothetical protein
MFKRLRVTNALAYCKVKGSSTGVGHSTANPEIEGLNPAAMDEKSFIILTAGNNF